MHSSKKGLAIAWGLPMKLSSAKCGAHHSKHAKPVKGFSYGFVLNAAFLGKDGEKYAYCS